MRLLADRSIRRLLLALSALLFVYAVLILVLCGAFSPAILLVSLAASFGVLLFCVLFLKKRDALYEDAVRKIGRFLSGERDERIACNEEGELFALFQSVNTLSAVLDSKMQREKQQNEFLKNTVSDISHQFKTPLAALTLYNGLLAAAEDPDEVRHFAEASDRELERMERLIKNLLILARLDAGAVVFDKHPENMAELMEDVKQRFSHRAAEEGKELRFSGGENVFPCDASWLAEAFSNLVKNALDHTAAGGVISVGWEMRGNLLNVTFRDNGCGIAPEELGHIFKRFYRSRNSSDTQGTGLGLPLAKTIIEAHNGMIEVESEEGRGTVFSVHFLIPTEL